MPSILLASSIETNPSTSVLRLTRGASDWLWAVFAVMLLTDLSFLFWSHRRPRGQRVFHQLPVVILTTSTIAYYAMASNLGRSAALTESGREPRDIFWVRYIQWFINAPLLLLTVLLATGLSLSDIFLTCFMSWVAVVCALVGAFTSTGYKWGFFAFGTLALLYIAFMLLKHARTSTFFAGPGIRTSYTGSAAWLSAVWLLYPVAWGLCEGGNKLGIAGEMIFYGVLDLLAGPLFLLFFLHRLRGIDYAALGLTSAKATGYTGGPGAAYSEKHAAAGNVAGAGPGGVGTAAPGTAHAGVGGPHHLGDQTVGTGYNANGTGRTAGTVV